jgi:hypothetical protein
VTATTAGVAYQRIIDRLRSDGRIVRESWAGQATAQCPAHDDRNPSLRITGIEGQVLVHCHAQCSIENVLAPLGITTRDLYDNPRDTSYAYEDGRNAHRTWDKRFCQTPQHQWPRHHTALPADRGQVRNLRRQNNLVGGG